MGNEPNWNFIIVVVIIAGVSMALESRASRVFYRVTPSNIHLIDNSAEILTASLSWVKVKEIRLVTAIYSESRFRFVFSMSAPTTTMHGRIYKNGVAIGNDNSMTGAYAVYTEDIAVGNWAVGDTIELWVYGLLANSLYVKDFHLDGDLLLCTTDGFVNTLGA